jgi:hypothetical protein
MNWVTYFGLDKIAGFYNGRDELLDSTKLGK